LCRPRRVEHRIEQIILEKKKEEAKNKKDIF
jgi:hypothetical protein